MEGLVQVADRVTSRGQIGLGFWPIFFFSFSSGSCSWMCKVTYLLYVWWNSLGGGEQDPVGAGVFFFLNLFFLGGGKEEKGREGGPQSPQLVTNTNLGIRKGKKVKRYPEYIVTRITYFNHVILKYIPIYWFIYFFSLIARSPRLSPPVRTLWGTFPAPPPLSSRGRRYFSFTFQVFRAPLAATTSTSRTVLRSFWY